MENITQANKISNRKLKRLSLIILCILCLYGAYLFLLFQSQARCVGSNGNSRDDNKDNKQFSTNAFIDAGPSENFMDNNEKNNVNDDPANGQSFNKTKAKYAEIDLHHPENKRISSISILSINVTEKFLKKRISKSKRAQPKFTKKPYSNVLPPAPVQNVTKRPEDKRYLVYMCDSSLWCGGWGDRQRGMMATYLLSRVVDREFKIIMTSPCDLRLFYKPNRVQWQPVGDELVSNSNISINTFRTKDFLTNVSSNEDLNSMYPEKVIYLRTNEDFYGYLKKNSNYAPIINQWGGISDRKPRFHWSWSDVMQPSHVLLAHLEQVVNTQFLIRKGLLQSSVARKKIKSIGDVGNSTFICSHVRMGKNPTNPTDENLQTFKLEYLPTLFNFMLEKDTQGNAKFFVATDFEHVQKEAKKIFGDRLVHYGGKIVHIDRQRGEENICMGFETALLDQLILSLCDILIVCRSGFSMTAAYMSNNTEHVYIMMKDGVIKKF